jgi:hypothetical protein
MEFIDGVNLRVLFRKATESKTPLTSRESAVSSSSSQSPPRGRAF